MLAVLGILAAKALAQHPLLMQRHVEALRGYEEGQHQQQVAAVEEEGLSQQHGKGPNVHAVPDIPACACTFDIAEA